MNAYFDTPIEALDAVRQQLIQDDTQLRPKWGLTSGQYWVFYFLRSSKSKPGELSLTFPLLDYWGGYLHVIIEQLPTGRYELATFIR